LEKESCACQTERGSQDSRSKGKYEAMGHSTGWQKAEIEVGNVEPSAEV
jgi:hypothetical protein